MKLIYPKVQMIIAKLETRNFTFEGAGTDRLIAFVALTAAVAIHLAEYEDEDEDGVSRAYFDDLLARESDTVIYTTYINGAAYRDEQRIKWPKGAAK